VRTGSRLSFVQRPEDVAEARALIGDKAALMAKIEKPAAIDKLNDIIALADGVMVARGDLGVELPPEEVPPLQNRIVASARQFGKPVVVATQMLESMITSPTPTRAEVSDVATAIYDGADAVMLSAESAAGKYPIEAVAMNGSDCPQCRTGPSLSAARPFYRDEARADDRRRSLRLRSADRVHRERRRAMVRLQQVRLDPPAGIRRERPRFRSLR
jgi:pyruvate kinase